MLINFALSGGYLDNLRNTCFTPIPFLFSLSCFPHSCAHSFVLSFLLSFPCFPFLSRSVRKQLLCRFLGVILSLSFVGLLFKVAVASVVFFS